MDVKPGTHTEACVIVMFQVLSIAHLCFVGLLCSCNQCGRSSALPSRFYELELNIQGHKNLSECVTEFLKVALTLSIIHIIILCYFSMHFLPFVNLYLICLLFFLEVFSLPEFLFFCFFFIYFFYFYLFTYSCFLYICVYLQLC